MASCSTKPPLKLSSLDTVLRSSHAAFRIFSLRASCCVTFCNARVSRFTRSVLHEGHLGCPQLLDAVHQSDVTNSSPENLCELPQHKPGREIGVGQTHAQVHHQVPPDSLSEWPCQVLHPPGRKGSSRFHASWPWPPAYCFAIPMDGEHPIVLMCIPLVVKEFGHLFRCRGAAAWFLHIWVVVVAFIFLVGFRSASSFTGLLCVFSMADPFLVLDVASAVPLSGLSRSPPSSWPCWCRLAPQVSRDVARAPRIPSSLRMHSRTPPPSTPAVLVLVNLSLSPVPVSSRSGP